MTARGASLALIWYEIHAEILDRHARPICWPENWRMAPHLNTAISDNKTTQKLTSKQAHNVR